MNTFLNSAPTILQRMLPPQVQNIMAFVQQVRQVQQSPESLAGILQKQGMIDANQAKEIKAMGTNYEMVGQYLIQNGRMPSNVQSYEGQVSQVQHLMK